MVDIDHFKKINDNYGHAAGDETLKTVVSTMLEELRKTDILARYGGEEFAILLPETELQLAASVAERLRDAISRIYVYFGLKSFTVTVSIGVAEHSRNTLNVLHLINTADAALYEAKHSGRNRIVIAE
jgi:diguanylate cyclase (GGDEF)-like protein